MAIGQWNPSVLDLVPGYLRTIRGLEAARQATQDEADKELLSEMIADCHYCLEWIRRGGNPYRRRGVEARYERPWDPKWLESYRSPHGWEIQRESRDLTEQERFLIEEAMHDLTSRERQCFMLYHVDGMSLSQISLELHIAKGTVQTNIERAQAKINEAKMNSLFLIG